MSKVLTHLSIIMGSCGDKIKGEHQPRILYAYWRGMTSNMFIIYICYYSVIISKLSFLKFSFGYTLPEGVICRFSVSVLLTNPHYGVNFHKCFNFCYLEAHSDLLISTRLQSVVAKLKLLRS